LLEGLEIAEIWLSGLERTKRLDSEYFLKQHLQSSALLRRGKTASLTSYVSVSDGNHFSISDRFIDEGIPYYRGQDVVGHFFIEQSTPVSISRDAYEETYMRRSHLKRGDVLLSIIGTIGEASLVSSEQEATCSCKLAILRPTGIESSYLAAFLRSKYGRSQTQRLTRGAVQMGLLLEDMDQVLVPEFSSDLKRAIVKLTSDAKTALETGNFAIHEAEQTLLRALGLENWQAPEPLSYTRSSRDVFTAGRFDAEYFHPAKQAALDKLSALSGRTVGEMFHSIRDLWQPQDPLATERVRNYDLTDALDPFLDNTVEPVIPARIASTKKRIQKGDLVVSRLRSYLREIAVVLDGGDTPIVASTEFIVLRPRKHSMQVEALLVFLRSMLPQLIFKWSQDGSNHPRFDEKELLNLRVPDIVLAQQNELAERLHSAIRLRRYATELLEAAKRAVEIAIETDEATAIEFLDKTKEVKAA